MIRLDLQVGLGRACGRKQEIVKISHKFFMSNLVSVRTNSVGQRQSEYTSIMQRTALWTIDRVVVVHEVLGTYFFEMIGCCISRQGVIDCPPWEKMMFSALGRNYAR